MKTVFDKSTVAHYWANQRQLNGRVAGNNFYFDGRTIYSYGRHFPIAVISQKDSRVVLFTTASYSNTTAKHIYETRSACSHKTIIYCNNPYSADQGNHSENISDFEQIAKNIASCLPKSKKPEKYLSQIAEQKEMLMKYVEFFKIKPSAYKHLHYIHIVTKDGAIVAAEKDAKQLAKEQKAREKQRIVQLAKQLEMDKERLFKWRKRQIPYNDNTTLNIYALKGTYLRFNKHSQEIETTKGVQIPIKVAERFYNWLKHQLAKGGCDGTCEHKILGYEVDTVNKEGIKVGCHDISWTEINAMAKKFKWS